MFPPIGVREYAFRQSEHGNVFSANQGERIPVCVPPIRVIVYVFCQSEKGKIRYAYQMEGKCITPIRVWESVFHQPLWGKCVLPTTVREMSSANQGEGLFVPPVRGRNMFPPLRMNVCSANQSIRAQVLFRQSG